MVSSSSRLDSKIRSVGQHDLDLGNFRLNFGAWGWIVFYIFALLGVLFPLLLRFVLLRDRFLAPDQSRHRVLISEDVLEIGRAPGTVRKRALFQRGYLTTHVGRFMYYSMQTLLYYMVLVMLLANAGRYIKRTHMRGYLYDFWGLAGEGAEGEERAKAGDGAVDDLDNKEEEEGNRTPLDAEVEYNFHLVFILVWLFLFGGILLFLSYKAELYNWCMKEVALEDAEFVAMEEQIREVPLAEEDTGFGNAAQETRGRTKKEAQTEAVEEAVRRVTDNYSNSGYHYHYERRRLLAINRDEEHNRGQHSHVLENCYVENTAHGRFLLFQCQKLQYASGDADHNPTASGAFIPPRNEILEAPLSTLLAKRDDPMTAHQIERDRTFRGLNSIEIALPSLLQWIAAELILVMNLWQIFRNVAVGYHDGVAFVAIPVFLFLLQVFLIARAKQTALQQIEEAADIAQISLRVYRAGESEPQMQLEDLRSQLQASKAKEGGLSEVERRESGGAEEVVGASTQDEQSTIDKSNQAQVQVAPGRDTHEPRWMVVNSCQLVPGDVFEVPDNCAMPCDAVLLDGYALINEADLTGEPMPVSKFPIEVEMGKGKDGKLDLAKHGKKNYLYCGTKVLQSVGATSSSTKRVTKVRQTLERSNSKGAKSGAAARSNSKNLVHLEDEEAGEGDVEDEEADQSANAAFQAIGLVVNTGPATTKGEMIRRILYPTPVRYAFIEQLPWFLFVSVLVFATCFSIPAALTSNRPALQFVQSMFFETVRMATLIIAPQLFLGLLMCQTNAKSRLFLSPARVKTLEPERLLMAGEVKVQCLDKTGTITEDGLQLSGTMPVVKVDGEVQLGELNLFNVGGSEPSGAVQMKNADTFLGDVGASGPLFSNMLAAGEVAPSSTVRPSGAEAQQEEDSPSVVEDSGEEEQQLVFDKNDLFAVAMATCHTVTKGTGSMTGELYGNMVEAEMVRKILSRGMDFRANVGENTVDYYKYTGRAADVDRAAGTRAKSSLPGGNYDAPEENPATAPRSSAAETEVNFDEPGEEERLDELHEDSFYLRRYLLDGEGGGPHDEGREVVDPAPNKNAVLRTVRQFEFDQTVQLQSVCVDLLNGKKYLLTKGSYDSVSKIVKPDTLPTNASKTLKSLAMEGFYVLAFAYRDLTFDLTGATTTATTTTTSSAPSSPSDRDAFLTMPRSDLEREETFLGFVLFRNELKVDSVAAIRELKRGEIQPIMVTGDNIWTGLHIGEEAGLIPRGAVVLAADVEPGRVAPELSWQYVKKEQAEYLPAWIDLLTSGKTLDYHAKLLYYGAEIMNASPPGSIIEEARQSQAAARRGSESSTLSGGTSRAADGAARRRASGEDLSSVRALRLGPVRNFVLSGHRKFPHEGKRWSKDVERPTLQFEGPGVEDAGDGYWIAGDGQDHFSRGFTQAASRALRRMKTAEQKLRLASCTVVKGRNANANTRTTDQTLGSAPSASSLVQLDGDEGAAKKTISELLSGILLRGTGSDASKNAPPDADVSANTEEGRPMNGDEAAKHLGNLHLEQDPSGPPAFYFALSEAAVNFLQERDPELLARIQRRIAVYGKVSPSGKVQVVRSLQRLNYVVGMCGDGGNDCAALRAAHAGMALSEGDASIVAAFSTPRKSLFGVVELIRQGRCCLRASTSLVELQMVVGAVYAGIVIVHSHNDTYFSDVCKTGAEVFPFACIVTLASALPPLHRGLVDPWGRMLVRRWSSRIFKGRGAEEVNQRFRPSVDGRSLLPGEVEQEVVGGGQANAANVVENEEDISSDSDDGGAGGQDGNAGRNARNDPQRSSSRASPEDRASNADPAKSSKKPDRTSEGEGCCGGSCSRRENWKPRRFRDGRWRMLSRSRTSGNLFERSRVLTMLLLFAFLATMLGGLMKLLNHQAWFVPYNLYSLNLKNGMGPNPTQVTRFDSGGVPTSHVLNWVFLFSIFTGLVAVSRDGKWRQRVWCNPMVALPVSMLAVLFVWPYYFGNNCWNLSLRINVDNRFSWETSDATATLGTTVTTIERVGLQAARCCGRGNGGRCGKLNRWVDLARVKKNVQKATQQMPMSTTSQQKKKKKKQDQLVQGYTPTSGRPVGPEQPGYVNRVLVPGSSFFPSQLQASIHTIVLDRDASGQPRERFESAGFSFFELNRPLYYPRADFDPREEFHHWFPHAYAHYPSGFVPIFSLYLALNTLFISLLTCALFHLFLKHEKLHFELLETTTHGDEVQNRHLADLGSVGVFTKELEVQLLERQSRFAVHSLKDMPTRLPPGLVHPRYLSASDAPVAAKDEGATATKDNGQNKKITSLHDLPATATIGSSSVRREALIRKHFPQMKVENIRGNLQTRIKKLEAADSPYDAIILAKVGLERLDLGQKIAFVLEEDEFPYAVSQGAYGVECREDDAEMKALLSEIKCVSSTYRCLAERALLASLDGGCQISMGVRTKFTAFKEGGNVAGKNQRKDLVEGGHEDEKNSSCATPADVAGELSIYAIVLSRDGADSVEAEEKFQIASEGDAATAGRSLGDRLRENGVARIWPNAGKEKRPITYGSAETAGLPSSGF
eukprot:g11423.t1